MQGAARTRTLTQTPSLVAGWAPAGVIVFGLLLASDAIAPIAVILLQMFLAF